MVRESKIKENWCHDFLTKPRHDAFLAARERFGINKCWTRDSCIYVKAPNGTCHRAENLADIDEIPDGTPVVVYRRNIKELHHLQ